MTINARKNMHPVQFLVIVGSLLLVVGLMAYILDGASGGPDRRAAARMQTLYDSGRLTSMTIDEARRAIRAPRHKWGTRQQGVYVLSLDVEAPGGETVLYVFDTDDQGRVISVERATEGETEVDGVEAGASS